MTSIKDIGKLFIITCLVGFVVVIFSFFSYFCLDRSLTLWVSQWAVDYGGLTKGLRFISKVFDPDSWFVVFVVSFLVLLWQYRKNIFFKKLYVFTLALFLALGVTTVLKVLCARYRPFLWLDQGLYGFHGFSFRNEYNSFPSGHSAMNFAGLLGVGSFIEHRGWKIALIAFACVIALSRIFSMRHYLSDILVGSYIGIFAYCWALSLIHFFFQKS